MQSYQGVPKSYEPSPGMGMGVHPFARGLRLLQDDIRGSPKASRRHSGEDRGDVSHALEATQYPLLIAYPAAFSAPCARGSRRGGEGT